MKQLVGLVSVVSLCISLTFSQQSITAVRIPTSIADGGGTGSTGYPYAVFVQIKNWTSAASSQAYVKLYMLTANEYMWSNSGTWSNTTTYSTANQPVVNIDASGNWSGWIYAKHNTALGASANVRAAKVGSTATNLTSAVPAFTILNMTSTGGWLVGQTSSASNKGIVAFAGGNMVGSYRTENNGITEGYTYGSGGFKMAAPVGIIDSVVAYNDDGSTFQTTQGPWIINAGAETDINNVITVVSGSATLSPTMMKFNTPTDFHLVFRPTTDTVRSIRIVKPGGLIWNSTPITVVPDSSVITTIGDTVQISHLALAGQDTLSVSFPGVTALDTTGNITVMVQSSTDGITFGQIVTLPQIFVYGSPALLSSVKAKDGSGAYLLNGKWVVVKGVATAANEFGGPTYLQDATAGIAVYDSSVSMHVTRGDEVVLLGKVSPYNEMFELNPCSLLQTVSEGNPFDTLLLTIAQIKGQPQKGVEPYECRMIRVNNITSVLTTGGSPTSTWATTGSGLNYELVSGTDTLEVRISSKTNLANMAVPSGKFDIVGVLGQFSSYYQILPRSYDDVIVEGGGPRITSGVPYETNITSAGLSFVWQTDSPGTSKVYYGTTSTYTDSVVDNSLATQHQVNVAGLKPATMYHVRLGTANAAGTTYTNDYLVSTSSLSSSGTMNMYFSYPVNTSLAQGENAQTASIVSKLLNRINAATYSIDVALYSFSGTVGQNVAQALIDAKGRGVKVRAIGEADNSGSSSKWGALSGSGIPVIFDTYDAINGGAGLMHNKFVTIDNRDSTSDTDDWVWTGSWNATDPGNNNDAQNVIEIQDKTLANAYTQEFNEMWGSTSDTANSSTSRFGAHKLDNTPHCFVVNGTPVELYFSPSDGTTNKIVKTLNRATDDINFALLTFTRNDIANVLVAKKKAGMKVRGVMDNRSDQGSVFDSLAAWGIDVHLKGAAVTGLFHHKYALVDAETFHPQQFVITGSHNWSSSAENSNNENTLIINSQRIANLYLQEFVARYKEAGGKDSIALSVEKVVAEVPNSFGLSQNYPNPFNPTTNFQLRIAKSGFVSMKVFDILGREVATVLSETMNPGVYTVEWDASKLASGVYLYRMQAGRFVETRKMLLIR